MWEPRFAIQCEFLAWTIRHGILTWEMADPLSYLSVIHLWDRAKVDTACYFGTLGPGTFHRVAIVENDESMLAENPRSFTILPCCGWLTMD